MYTCQTLTVNADAFYSIEKDIIFHLLLVALVTHLIVQILTRLSCSYKLLTRKLP